jgi:hypothetical protein
MLVVALLCGTAAAFAVTQTRKAERSPISGTRVAKVFSPVCECETARATIRFALRHAGEVRLEILRGGDTVRTLVAGRQVGAGRRTFTWNGRDDAGRVVDDGAYAPRVELDGQEFDLPNSIRVDTAPPRIDATLAGRTLRYRMSERGHPLVFADGERIVRGYWPRPAGRLLLPAGLDARITVAAEDLAGNVSSPVTPR